MGESRLLKELSDSVRPILTYLFALIYIGVSTWAVIVARIEFSMFFAQIGTMVGMMISFWFGEKSALKNPLGTQDVNSNN
jgi:hypothetical protein